MRAEETLGSLLRRKGATLALAESCTGGMIADLITDVPGSSDYFLVSFVTYSNESKINVLGVSEITLREHGAVSEETAKEMATGAREASGSSIALAVTGITGPSGGTPTKPVGLVHFALDDGRKVLVDRVIFTGGRIEIKRSAAEHGMRLVIRYFGD